MIFAYPQILEKGGGAKEIAPFSTPFYMKIEHFQEEYKIASKLSIKDECIKDECQ